MPVVATNTAQSSMLLSEYHFDPNIVIRNPLGSTDTVQIPKAIHWIYTPDNLLGANVFTCLSYYDYQQNQWLTSAV